MATTATIEEYRNRTVDHIAFDDITEGGSDFVPLTQSLVRSGESGALVTGIQKLVQRFLIELMTDRGSLIYSPNRGTTFMLDAKRGFWRTVTDVEQSFYGALLTLEDNLITEENVDDPPEEKYSNAVLISVAVTGDSVTMRMQLSSQAGTSREIIHPIRVNSFGT